MSKVRIIFMVLVIFGLVGCATILSTFLPPPPEPLGPQRAVIGITVKARGFITNPDTVYFINVAEGEDLYTQEFFIRSNYCRGRQFYLINAGPGCYAAVAWHREFSVYRDGVREDYEYWIFFPKELIKLTKVTVAPGTTAFMGEYVVDSSMSFEDADDAQLHYFKLLAPPGARHSPGFLRALFSTRFYYKGSLREEKCDMQDEIKFLRNALEHFKGTDWTNAIQKRLEELKGEK